MKWNEVTWYSKLGAAILLFAVLPLFSFYIGSEYQKLNQQSENTTTTPSYSAPIVETPAEVPEQTEVIEDPIRIDPITPTPTPKPMGACYKGGCSGQLCSDNPDMASTCEYREEYACYQSAVCERQTNGQCGWTETNALKMCLSNAASL